MLWVSQSDEYGREECEYVSLNECYQHLHAVHEEKHQSTEDIESCTHSRSQCPSEEYHTGEAKDDFTKQIDAEVDVQRSDEGKAMLYMTWEQEQMEAEAKGVKIGRQEKEVEDVKNLINNTGWTLEKAMNALGLDEESRSNCIKALA